MRGRNATSSVKLTGFLAIGFESEYLGLVKRKPKRMKPVAHDVPTAPPTARFRKESSRSCSRRTSSYHPASLAARLVDFFRLVPNRHFARSAKFHRTCSRSSFNQAIDLIPNRIMRRESLTSRWATNYDIDSRGFRRSRVGREIINLQQQAETERAWERALSEPSESEAGDGNRPAGL